MSGQSFVASPTSRNNLRNIANFVRSQLGLQNATFFPIMQVLELALPTIDNKFYYEIVPINEMGNRHGLTYPDQSIILIREDVYVNACNGQGRDRFTVAHEIGHYFLHKPQNLAAARTAPGQKIPAYMDPEWQAHTFAGELLAPRHIIKGMKISQISVECGLSMQAAEIQFNNQFKN